MTESPSQPHTGILHPTLATVNLSHLRHNARVLMRKAGSAEIMAVIKANAYGHGALPVARALREAGIRHFAVATLPEAIALRESGITEEILVFAAPVADQLPAYQRYDLQVDVTSAAVARWVADAAITGRPLRVQVKVDTGMNRLGLDPSEAPEAIDRLGLSPGITLEGVWTHLATADDPDTTFAQEQVKLFRSVLERLRVRPRWIHAANSAGLLLVPEAMQLGPRVLARTGLALYGLMEQEEQIARFDLRPAMTVRSFVKHVQVVRAGESVSYGRRWRAAEPSIVATVGCGYADGLQRILSNRASLGIKGHRYPVAGSICMDMTMLFIGPAEGDAVPVRVGDEVIIFGEGGPSAVELAHLGETIPYEICCGINERVPREYV